MGAPWSSGSASASERERRRRCGSRASTRRRSTARPKAPTSMSGSRSTPPLPGPGLMRMLATRTNRSSSPPTRITGSTAGGRVGSPARRPATCATRPSSMNFRQWRPEEMGRSPGRASGRAAPSALLCSQFFYASSERLSIYSATRPGWSASHCRRLAAQLGRRGGGAAHISTFLSALARLRPRGLRF